MAGEAVLNNRYELVAQQGSGGMSVVYKAVDRLLGRNVAVKILRPSLTQDPSFLEKFKQEARSIANLSHPNIVTVYDVGSDGPTHYIVMELIEGQDLKRIIKAQGAMPVDQVMDLSIQIAAGLGYAHRSGLVHADVKPQNLLVTREKVVKITDFGIAQALTDTQPQQRAEIVWGSPHYFAPEQARGEPPSPASDVYAIGIVMFEMLTGRLPYSGASQQDLAMAHIQSPIPSVTEFNPTVPESLSKIVQRLMSKEPAQRYQTGSQLEQVLTQMRNQSREYTMRNPIPPVASSQSQQTPSQQQSPSQRSQPQTIVSPVQNNRPPGVSMPPAAPISSEPTARFSAAPSAPQPYNPRQPNVPGAQPSVPSPLQQPLEQRYSVPPAPQPGMRPMSGDSGHVMPQYGNSQPYRVGRYEEESLDRVTLALMALAVLAVLGLCPLALLVAGR